MNNTLQVMELFPIPVFINQIENIDNEKLCELIYAIRDEEIANGNAEKSGLSSLGGFRTYDLLERPGFEQIKHAIVDTLNNKILQGKWYLGEGIEQSDLSGMWSIINQQGHANSVHNHPHSWFSGVYYPKVPKDVKNAGALCFRDPILARTYTRTFYRSSQSEVCSLLPEQGRMVIFPGWFEHSVRPNQTNEDRIAISFNIRERVQPF